MSDCGMKESDPKSALGCSQQGLYPGYGYDNLIAVLWVVGDLSWEPLMGVPVDLMRLLTVKLSTE